MISVPNHQQPSNGSKHLVLAFLIVSTLTSCKALKPAQQDPGRAGAAPHYSEKDAKYLDEIRATRVYDPVTQQWIVVSYGANDRIDTLRLKLLPPDAQTITSFPDNFTPGLPPVIPALNAPAGPMVAARRIEKKRVYDVAVALPFLTGITESAATGAEGRVARWAINFYAGVKLAGPILEAEGVSLRVAALDTKADSQAMVRLLEQPELAKADVIIGPYRRDNIRMTAEYAKKTNKIIVSPYSAVGNLVDSYPGFLQVNPSLESHCKAQLAHALKEFTPEEVLVVTRENATEKACVEFLQKANLEWQGDANAKPLRTFSVTNPTYGGISVGPLIQGKEQLAIIVPSWADQNFIFFLLRRIADAKTDKQKIVVYGMPQWMEYENFEYEFFERLHVRVSNNAFLDPLNTEVQEFKQKYFDTYGTIPDLAAFQGYDLFMYMGRMLQEYGQFFQFYLAENPSQAIHTRFEFYPVVKPGATTAELSDNINYLENKFVHILEFRDYQFQLLR